MEDHHQEEQPYDPIMVTYLVNSQWVSRFWWIFKRQFQSTHYGSPMVTHSTPVWTISRPYDETELSAISWHVTIHDCYYSWIIEQTDVHNDTDTQGTTIIINFQHLPWSNTSQRWALPHLALPGGTALGLHLSDARGWLMFVELLLFGWLMVGECWWVSGWLFAVH